jgi:hypothetical protein
MIASKTKIMSSLLCIVSVCFFVCSEAESKEKYGVWDPMSELTVTSPYVDKNTFNMDNPMP